MMKEQEDFLDSPARTEKHGLLEEQIISDHESEGEVFVSKGILAGSVKPWHSAADVISTSFRSDQLRSFIGPTIDFMTPSFMQGPQAQDMIRPSKLSPTSYLDGLRGLSALFVFFCHYFYQAFIVAEGWGAGETNYGLLKLPFVRIWYQGPPAVCMFFVISGYALSYRPLKFIRSRSMEDFSTTLSSLTFRRGIRLFLPTAISMFIVVLFLRIGVYEWSRPFANDRRFLKNVAEPHPERLPTTWMQLVHYFWTVFNFIHIFDWDQYGGSTLYDVHLWTIPVEYRCSLYLFLVLMGTARLQTKYRFLTVAWCILFAYWNCRWELTLFFFGMILAETDLIRGAHSGPIPPPFLGEVSKWKMPNKSFRPSIWAVVIVISLYLMSGPDLRPEVTPGWVTLTSMIPPWWVGEKYRYWQSIGAVLFIWAIGHCPSWQSFFNCDVVQYFGKISYALYLVHGPVLHCVGYHIEKMAWSLTGVEGYWYNLGFIIGSVFIIPIVIWAADMFWRGVDMPTVRFAKWVETKVIVRS